MITLPFVGLLAQHIGGHELVGVADKALEEWEDRPEPVFLKPQKIITRSLLRLGLHESRPIVI